MYLLSPTSVNSLQLPFLASWSSFPLQLRYFDRSWVILFLFFIFLGHFILYDYPAVVRSASVPKLLLRGNSSDSNRIRSENFDLISLFERAVHISLPGNFGDCSFPFGRGKLASQSLQERWAVCQWRQHSTNHSRDLEESISPQFSSHCSPSCPRTLSFRAVDCVGRRRRHIVTYCLC